MRVRREHIHSLLVAAALVAPLAWAGDGAVPAKTSSELGRLEQVLTQAQQARNAGEFQPDRYEEFLTQFRGSLDSAWAACPRSNENSAAFARIVARLGKTAQALAVLGPALKQSPDDPDLKLTSGEVHFENKNYSTSLAMANAVLAKDPGNNRALALKHFSQGRISGVSPSSKGLPSSEPEDSRSIWTDPRIVQSGQRTIGRMNSIYFMDQAVDRLKIKDPGEALRFLALAEVSDPASADVAMQQGLAYIDLKEPMKALGRFSQAEERWQAAGNGNAELARTMKARVTAQLAVQLEPPQQAPTVNEAVQIKSTGFIRGFLHYIGSSATSRRVDFNEIDSANIKVEEFPAVAAELIKPALNREVAISDRMNWAAPGSSKYLLGNITLLLKGQLTIHPGCRWSFKGSLRAFDDVYDFNKARRGWLAESMTTLGRTTPGKLYKMEIRGVRAISQAGTKENCP